MSQPPRPERIAAMRARMVEIGRATTSFRDALRESNDEHHQAFFAPVLDRIALIVANERSGITAHLADDLSAARSALRRLPLPDIDPDLNEPTRALKRLRGERGNLVEALDNALDAAQSVGMAPGLVEFGELRVQRNAFANQLIRLDERLRVVQDAVTDLRAAATAADAALANTGVSQTGLVNTHIQSLTVEVSAARFETRVGDAPGIPDQTDLTSLARSIEAMRDLAGDLKETVDGLGTQVAAAVKATGVAVATAAERSWRGMRIVVSVVRRQLAGSPNHPAQDTTTPPPDFDIDRAHRIILVGMAPPVRWHPWITGLNFAGEPLQDVAPLSDLTRLHTLSLDGTQVTDLAPLSDLIGLRMLFLRDTQVSDLAPLSGLTGLQMLELSGTKMSDLAPLSSLTSLYALDLRDTRVGDLAPLSSLTGLQTLNLRHTQVNNLTPLSDCTRLQALDLSNTQVSELAPLSGLTRLRTLDLNGTEVRDLAPLSGLTNLQTLDLDRTRVSDLLPLSRLTSLLTLDLRGTQVSDLAPISGFTHLQALHLNGTQVRGLAPLSGLTALQRLGLHSTWVSDLAPLSGLSRLQTLDLSRTQVDDLSPLSGFTSLHTLSLKDTQVSELAPLSGLTGLQTLDLQGTRVCDLAPLSNLSGLQALDLSNTLVTDLAPLSSLPALQTVYVDGTVHRQRLAPTLGNQPNIQIVISMGNEATLDLSIRHRLRQMKSRHPSPRFTPP
jgi:Leucine-rich repeat (LRR) protein